MMEKVHHSLHLLLLLFLLSLHLSDQLQQPQTQAVYTIQQLLNYPPAMNTLSSTPDLCNTEPSPSFTLVCYDDNLTQLHIVGNNNVVAQSFSSQLLFDTLAVGLPNLKVLTLASLGLWGPLPASIGNLSSLEILNVSSNYLSGAIPVQLSSLRSLQTLILDHNKFTGQLPHRLTSLATLAVLSLKNNSLGGSLPTSLSTMDSLRVLALSTNYLYGEVPDLANLTNLQVLDLEDNFLGPHFPILHNKLVTLVLRKNKFRFSIPTELGSYYQLQKLDISSNGFVGPFVSSLLSLPSIAYLDVSENRFTGKLFENMSCSSELVYANLSMNLLSGDLPSCLHKSFNSRVVMYSHNCLSGGSQEQQHPSSFCTNQALAVNIPPPPEQKQNRAFSKAVLALGITGGMLGGMLLVTLLLLATRRDYHNTRTMKKDRTRLITENVLSINTAKMLTDARYIVQTMKLGALGLPVYRAFPLEELKDATSNFSSSSLIDEDDNSQIHRGKLADGTVVAIRSLKMRKRHSPQSYTHHIELISKLRHRHLASALGHCLECYPDDSSVSRMFLIFEFVPNRTLRSCISGYSSTDEGLPGKKLTWNQRIGAAIGVTKGIQFLHTGIVPGVFSNNLKITDVFLDHNLHVKISINNLPLLAESGGVVTPAVSSSGARVQARAQHMDKNDVYGIGVILLEIIVGRPIMSPNEVVVSKDLLQVSTATDETARRSIVDPAVHKECLDESLKTMMELCMRCLSSEPSDRPSIEDVLWNLQFAAQVQDSGKADTQYHQETVSQHPISQMPHSETGEA